MGKIINHHPGHRASNSILWMTQAVQFYAYLKKTSTFFGVWVHTVDKHTPCPDAWVLQLLIPQMGGGFPRYLDNWKSTCGAQMTRLICRLAGTRFRLLSGLVEQRAADLTVWVANGCDTDFTQELVRISRCVFMFLTITLGCHRVRGLFLPRHRHNWPRLSGLHGFSPFRTFLILTQIWHQGIV